MSWQDILGQKRAVALLKSDLQTGRVAESYLFVGPPGTGKRKTAIEFAKSLNCEKSNSEPQPENPSDQQFLFAPEPTAKTETQPKGNFQDSCGLCVSCKKIDSGSHPEIFVLDFESQSRLLELDEEESMRQKDYRIESVRALISRAQLSTLGHSQKVFIIDGAELLNASASNAMLKSLEESPKSCRWLLLASSLDQVMITVRSRCRKVIFAPLTSDVVESVIARSAELTGEQLDRSELKKISATCDGSAGTARFLISEVSETCRETAGEIARLSAGKERVSPREILKHSARVLAEGKRTGLKRTAEQFLKVLSLETAKSYRETPSPKSADALARVIQSREELHRNVSPQMVLDSLFLDVCQ